MKISKKVSVPKHKKVLIPTGIALLLISGFFGLLKFHDIFSPKETDGQLSSQNSKQPEQDKESEEYSNLDDKKEEQPEKKDDESSNNANQGLASEVGSYTWVVNKTRPLDPKGYTPPNLAFPNVRLRVPGNESMKIRSDVATAIEQMFVAAQSEGHSAMFSSGYRSYSYQVSLYGGYVKSQGQAEADKQSARPGYSEHQTGLAFDICNADSCKLEQSFGTTPLGIWVANNAHKYGFTIRYKENKQDITGYMYEPWHLRYVGVELATELNKTNSTLEEYFSLPVATDYR